MGKIPIYDSLGTGNRGSTHNSSLGKNTTTYSSTKSTNIWEMQQKIILFWYLTPHRISKIYRGTSPLCRRLCGGSGRLVNILWHCPKLRTLWSQVENLMSYITYLNQPLKPGMAILSLELDFIPTPYRTVVYHILLATRLTIL